MRTKLTLILNLILLTGYGRDTAQVVTWQGPEGFTSDRHYRVKVNGKPVSVYDTPIASYAVFDFSGKIDVEVTTMYDVRWVDIRPLRTGLKAEYLTDSSFRFSMDAPANLSLELNGRIRQQPLFIFSGKPEKEKPLRTDKNVVWFEGGKQYKDVKLELQDNQTVYIEGGAVVQGYISAQGKKNIHICGRGILDGSFNNTPEGGYHRGINLEDCENITIRDVILHNGTSWQIAIFHCNQAEISGVRIVSESGSDDGMDIFRCTNVLVDGVFAHTKDDCIAIKSGGDYPASYPTDNIVVRNCVFWNSIWGNAVEIGFELFSNEVKNIRFENIDIIHVEDGAAMSIHNAGQSHVQDVVFEDIRVEDARQKLFDIAIFLSQYSPDANRDPEYLKNNYLHGAWDGVQKIPIGKEETHRQFRGTISHIEFKNIQVVGGSLPFSIFHGFDAEKNISGITIENLTYLGRRLLTTEDARIRLQNTNDFRIE
jgi:hypothetical protein